MKTIQVPANLYDQAVRFCNDRLAEDNNPPITKLPPGLPRNFSSCPCGEACKVSVGTYTWSRFTDKGPSKKGAPSRFVRFFDRCLKNGEFYLPIRNETITENDPMIFGEQPD